MKDSNSSHPHSHGHSHGHHHGHSHGGSHEDVLVRIRFAFWLNFIFAIFEFAGGLWTNSVAILSNATHDLGDALAIGTAYFLEKKSKQKGDNRYSYGYRRLSTISAVFSGVVLICGSLVILAESIPRLLNPVEPKIEGMMAFAVVGILVNGVGIWRMYQGNSLNERVIAWHLFEDLMGWILVFVGAILMKFVNWPILDSVLGIVLSLWVIWNVIRNIREGLRIFLQAAPSDLELQEIEKHISSQPGVRNCHHTHLWTMDGQGHILTTHLVVDASLSWADCLVLKNSLKKQLLEKFQILEATVELEQVGEDCLDPSHH
jgi:cobalt-zinc-cadmium efflux system protein